MAAPSLDHLARLMPPSHRRTNQIFTAEEAAVFPFLATDPEGATGVSFINDGPQLDDFIENCKRSDNIQNPVSTKTFFQNLVSASTINTALIKVDFAKLNLQNKITPTGLADFDYIIVREDSLRDVKIGEFLELYCRTPPLRQPQILFVPNENSNLCERLRYSNPNMTIVDLKANDGPRLEVPRSAPRSLGDFAELYQGRCFQIAGQASVGQIAEWTSSGGQLPEVAMLAIRSRARLLSAERHDVETDIDALLRQIDVIIDNTRETDIEAILSIRVAVLLQKLYCSENPAYLTEALGLASSLGDELGLAACLRYAEFLDVHPALAKHMYRRAETIFAKHGSTELELYCINNRLVAEFATHLEPENEFPSLIAQVGSRYPGLYRRHDLLYNAGVRLLLERRISEAWAVFDDPEMLSARALVRSSAALAILICRHLSGERVRVANVERLIEQITKEVQPTNRWHITNLILNALLLVRSDHAALKYLGAMVEPHICLGGELDVRDCYDENSRIAALVGLASAGPTNRVPGPFGDFQSKYGFAIPYYFIWS